MVRNPLTPEQVEAGKRLGRFLREARADRDSADVAAAAGISPETLRKIETGRLPSPAFGTVVGLAEATGVDLDALAALPDPLQAGADHLAVRSGAGGELVQHPEGEQIVGAGQPADAQHAHAHQHRQHPPDHRGRGERGRGEHPRSVSGSRRRRRATADEGEPTCTQ